MIRFLTRLAQFNPVLGVGHWIAFLLVQVKTGTRAVCAILPPATVTRYPVGRGHIHWCVRHEADDHGVHRCHGCSLVWYDPSIHLLHYGEYAAERKIAEAIGTRDNEGNDDYGFTVYAA